MTVAPLRLISFASRHHTEEILRRLCGLGHEVASPSVDDWLHGPADASAALTVLLLASRDLPRADIVTALKRRGSAPALAILHPTETGWVPEILESCDEFACWPGSEHELELRLRRLLPESFMHADGEAADIATEFARLGMIGRSPTFLGVLDMIIRIARCDAPVQIQGKTGTGKEMAARAIHYLGDRQDFPFTPINCGAIPDNLLENELFGHERGAFTDAKEAQRGLVAQAEGGSLFLDEVDTLSAKAQVTLLRFLQDYEYKPLGGKRSYRANVRIIAASNSKLEDLVERGEFRQDLWFRLNVLSLTMPPLAERPADIPLLAEHFLHQYCRQYDQSSQRFSPRALAWMSAYHWPGNVRELENLVHRAVLTSDGPVKEISHLVQGGRSEDGSPLAGTDDSAGGTFSEAKSRVIADFEKQYLERLMCEAGGNVTLAAKLAGKERRALGKLLKKHGITRRSWSFESMSMSADHPLTRQPARSTT